MKVEHGVDVHDSITLEFENGVKAFMEASLDGPVRKDMTITGTKGNDHTRSILSSYKSSYFI